MSLLMGLWEQIISFKVPFKTYAKFFHSTDVQDSPTTTFTYMYSLPPWAYQIVPLNGDKPNNLILNTGSIQKKCKQDFMKMNCTSIVIDIFSELDKENTKDKEYPVRWFYIDLRMIKLQNKF